MYVTSLILYTSNNNKFSNCPLQFKQDRDVSVNQEIRGGAWNAVKALPQVGNRLPCGILSDR